jgi:hypothetical protein
MTMNGHAQRRDERRGSEHVTYWLATNHCTSSKRHAIHDKYNKFLGLTLEFLELFLTWVQTVKVFFNYITPDLFHSAPPPPPLTPFLHLS